MRMRMGGALALAGVRSECSERSAINIAKAFCHSGFPAWHGMVRVLTFFAMNDANLKRWVKADQRAKTAVSRLRERISRGEHVTLMDVEGAAYLRDEAERMKKQGQQVARGTKAG